MRTRLNGFVRITLSAGAGVCLGLLMTSLLSAYAMLLYLRRGADPFTANGTSLTRVLLAYTAGGLVGGLLAGLAAPVLKGRMGAAIGGALAALPLYTAIAYSLDGPATLRAWPLLLAVAALVGGPCGLGFRAQFGEWYDAAFGNDGEDTEQAA